MASPPGRRTKPLGLATFPGVDQRLGAWPSTRNAPPKLRLDRAYSNDSVWAGFFAVGRYPGLVPLLLVVHGGAGDLRARQCSRHGYGAAFAVRRHHDFAAGRDLAVLLVGEFHGVRVNDLVRPR